MSPENISGLSSPIGLIAGSGSLPFEFIERASGLGLEVVTVAHKGETDPAIEKISKCCSWVKVGQLGKVIRALKKNGVKQACFAGGINKPRLFRGLSLDLKGFLTFLKLKTTNDDVLLRGISAEIEDSGIEIFSAAKILKDSVAKKGQLTRRGLTASEKDNAEIGWKAAQLIGQCDIGQTVVVHTRSIVAVEAVEGTDACLKRAGELSGPGSVVVKLFKPGQDARFDMPAVGIDTITNMHAIGATALVLKEQGAILLKPTEIVSRADELGIAIEVW